MGIVSQLQQVVDSKAARKAKIGKVVTIMSPKGGAGKTMTTVNVALSLAQWGDPNRVVILDADLQFGDVCISLQVDPRHTIVDVARDIDKLDEPLLDSLLARHTSGMRVSVGAAGAFSGRRGLDPGRGQDDRHAQAHVRLHRHRHGAIPR